MRKRRAESYFLAGQDLAGMLDALADSAAHILAKKGNGGRRLAFDDIRLFNQSRYSAIIFNDSTPLVKGVYRDFQEFRNNAPSIHNFETTKKKDRLLLYLKEGNGNSFYSRTAWGYCDGKNIYVMKDGVLILTWREGKAFYLLGQPEEDYFPRYNPPSAEDVAASYHPGSDGETEYGTIGRRTVIRHVFTVDPDSGKLY
jgi:hypothetical protein